MKTKLILVEGLPGSGKSTLAKRISDFYSDCGLKTNLYQEGGFHPANLAWNACVPLKVLDRVLAPYKNFRDEIDQNTHIEDDYAVISYAQVKTGIHEFYQDMESYEVYDNRVPFDVFRSLHQKRWQAFGMQAEDKNELSVFECAFLQNHMTELIYFHLADAQFIKTYFHTLIQTVSKLSPFLIYLTQPNIRETIQRAAAQRGDWIDGFTRYVENSPYGRRHVLTGLDGMITALEERKRMELEIIFSLPIPCMILDNPNDDWEALWNSLEPKLPIE